MIQLVTTECMVYLEFVESQYPLEKNPGENFKMSVQLCGSCVETQACNQHGGRITLSRERGR